MNNQTPLHHDHSNTSTQSLSKKDYKQVKDHKKNIDTNLIDLDSEEDINEDCLSKLERQWNAAHALKSKRPSKANSKGQSHQKANSKGQTSPKTNHSENNFQQFVCEVCCLRPDSPSCQIIFDCSHSLCNDCFKYWSSASNKCPFCLKLVTTLIKVMGESIREDQLKFNNHGESCVKCSSTRNVHLKYYCDQCERACVHTYCQKSLEKQRKKQSWICDHCKGNRLNKKYKKQLKSFQEISISSNSFIDDEEISDSALIMEEEGDEQVKTRKKKGHRQRNSRNKK